MLFNQNKNNGLQNSSYEEKLTKEEVYLYVLESLNIDVDILNVILCLITKQRNMTFELVKFSPDLNILFFKDTNKKVFSVPYIKIMEYKEIYDEVANEPNSQIVDYGLDL